MPNKTIYLDTINKMEEALGTSFINREELAKKLQDAWKNDTTNDKHSYLTAYREVFCSVLKQWSEHEFSIAYNTRAQKGAALQDVLLKTDAALKVCALSLLPELRENPTTLWHMTFGSMKPDRLKREFIAAGKKYEGMKEAEAAMKKRREAAYAKYKEEWKTTPIRKITELIRDGDALKSMSMDEKIDYAMALNLYRDDNTLARPLGSNEKGWIDDALVEWRKEIGCAPNEPIDEAAVSQYTRYGKKLARGDGFDAKILAAVLEYNKTPNPAQKEIKEYNDLVEVTAEFKRESEQIVKTEGITDETAEMVDDFFGAEEREYERVRREEKRMKESTSPAAEFTDEAAETLGDFFAQEPQWKEEAAQRKRMQESTTPAAEFTDEAAEMLGDFFAQEPQWHEEARIAEERAKEAKAAQKVKESTVKNEGVTDDAAEMVGDFFMQAELEQEIEEVGNNPRRKEREYVEEAVKSFNEKYAMRVNNDKLRTSAEQVAGLMIRAREEKERFMSKDSIVVIENGEEKCYEAKEYFKDLIEESNKKYIDKITALEEERTTAEQKHKALLDNIKLQADMLKKVPAEGRNADVEKLLNDKKADLDKQVAEAEKALKDKNVDIDQELALAKGVLQEDLSITQGGLVIEKNGKTVRRYKASQYYETHETQKEQYAYGEYQQMYARVYKDACKSIKEQNYAKGKVTDFATIAKDVDKLFKSAMYISNIYDNEKNVELMQKCSFGGFSPEQLAAFTAEIEKDPWSLNQSGEEAWTMQKVQAKNILSQWSAEEKANPKVKPSDRVKETLDSKRALFAKGEISRKEMLDYMIAADAHLQGRFSTRSKKIFSFIQYNREKDALKECLAATGVKDNASLRIEMNLEYTKMAQSMSKEQVFKSIEETVNNTPTFQKEKEALAREHQIVQDRKVAEKTAQLEQLKTSGREPISIHELDERNAILNKEPRVAPITHVPEAQKNINLNK